MKVSALTMEAGAVSRHHTCPAEQPGGVVEAPPLLHCSLHCHCRLLPPLLAFSMGHYIEEAAGFSYKRKRIMVRTFNAMQALPNQSNAQAIQRQNILKWFLDWGKKKGIATSADKEQEVDKDSRRAELFAPAPLHLHAH